MTLYSYEVWENEDGPGFYFTINAEYGATYDDPGDIEAIYIDETIYATYEEADAAGKALYKAEYTDGPDYFEDYDGTYAALIAERLLGLED